jgi:hypothetical protein
MVSDAVVATVVLVAVTASFPFFLYGARIMIDADVVTWGTLLYHLKFIGTGLGLTTIPLATWMLPRIGGQLSDNLAVVHAFFGLQAYALLTFGLTGIVRIVQAKRTHDLYRNPDQDVALSDIHENADAWRKRLRIGVFGYVVLWLVAYLFGVVRYVLRYGSTLV